MQRVLVLIVSLFLSTHASATVLQSDLKVKSIDPKSDLTGVINMGSVHINTEKRIVSLNLKREQLFTCFAIGICPPPPPSGPLKIVLPLVERAKDSCQATVYFAQSQPSFDGEPTREIEVIDHSTSFCEPLFESAPVEARYRYMNSDVGVTESIFVGSGLQ